MNYIFVGERPSNLALKMNVNLKDGRLAGKQLFDALLANGIDPLKQRYINIFHIDRDVINPEALKKILRSERLIVAMGEKVKKALTGLYHYDIVHPAARGKIRKKELYYAHVKDSLFSTRIYEGFN